MKQRSGALDQDASLTAMSRTITMQGFTSGSITDAEKMILQHNFDVKINKVNGL